MTQQLDSMGAMRALADYLGMNVNEESEKTVTATFRNLNSGAQGKARLTLNSNWRSNRGISLEFQTSLKNWGIGYQNFSPLFQRMQWDEAADTLTVTGDGYSFELEF